jgi:hypothetical protein
MMRERERPTIRFECEVYEYEREKKPANSQQIYKLILMDKISTRSRDSQWYGGIKIDLESIEDTGLISLKYFIYQPMHNRVVLKEYYNLH